MGQTQSSAASAATSNLVIHFADDSDSSYKPKVLALLRQHPKLSFHNPQDVASPERNFEAISNFMGGLLATAQKDIAVILEKLPNLKAYFENPVRVTSIHDTRKSRVSFAEFNLLSTEVIRGIYPDLDMQTIELLQLLQHIKIAATYNDKQLDKPLGIEDISVATGDRSNPHVETLPTRIHTTTNDTGVFSKEQAINDSHTENHLKRKVGVFSYFTALTKLYELCYQNSKHLTDFAAWHEQVHALVKMPQAFTESDKEFEQQDSTAALAHGRLFIFVTSTFDNKAIHQTYHALAILAQTQLANVATKDSDDISVQACLQCGVEKSPAMQYLFAWMFAYQAKVYFDAQPDMPATNPNSEMLAFFQALANHFRLSPTRMLPLTQMAPVAENLGQEIERAMDAQFEALGSSAGISRREFEVMKQEALAESKELQATMLKKASKAFAVLTPVLEAALRTGATEVFKAYAKILTKNAAALARKTAQEIIEIGERYQPDYDDLDEHAHGGGSASTAASAATSGAPRSGRF
jgi:hypothetical protein